MKADGNSGFCTKCFYIKRGSFAGLKNQEFVELVRKNPQLREKLFGCLFTFPVFSVVPQYEFTPELIGLLRYEENMICQMPFTCPGSSPSGINMWWPS